MWWGECLLLITDLAGLPEWYEFVRQLLKWNTRQLNEKEVGLAREVYGNSLPWSWIRMDGRSFLGPPQLKIAYVSFCTINYWRKLVPSVFIHELMHVRQFYHEGSIYLIRALVAQRTKAGYNYGGLVGLQAAKESGKKLNAFNYEQQADIVADAWRRRQGQPARWVTKSKSSSELLEQFAREVWVE